jgi:hypothetical protein
LNSGRRRLEKGHGQLVGELYHIGSKTIQNRIGMVVPHRRHCRLGRWARLCRMCLLREGGLRVLATSLVKGDTARETHGVDQCREHPGRNNNNHTTTTNKTKTSIATNMLVCLQRYNETWLRRGAWQTSSRTLPAVIVTNAKVNSRQPVSSIRTTSRTCRRQRSAEREGYCPFLLVRL